MLANPAVPAGRSSLAPTRDVTAERPGTAPRPAAFRPWSRNHLTFRGTRILTALALFWTGTIVAAFGGLVVPSTEGLGGAQQDPGLMDLLGTAAPWLVVLGVAHIIAAWGAARDRRWWIGLATWLLAATAFVLVAGAVMALAGRDPVAFTSGAAAAHGIGIVAWSLALLGVVGWGVRSVGVARGLL